MSVRETIRLPRTQPRAPRQQQPAKRPSLPNRVLQRVPAPEILVSPAVIGWLTARLAIIGALAFSRYLVNQLGAADPAGRPSSGLLGWDASWYVRIVSSGYENLPWESMRFFPLLPTLSIAFRPLFGARFAILLVVNGAALASGILLSPLAKEERGDDALAGRAGWLFALVPPAFVFAMGYAEALFVLCSILTFLGLRRGRFGWAAAAGLLAGLSRPLGVLVAIPAIVESIRGWRRANRRERVSRVLASLAPFGGMVSYLVWSGIRFGDPLRPFTVQQAFDRRGAFEDPISSLLAAARQLLGGSDVGSGLHLPWALAFLAMLVLVFRRWPVSYGLFAGAILVVALSAENLDSLERYGLSAFPLVLAAAELLRQPAIERVAATLCGAGLVAYATLAFLGAYVP